MSSALSVTQALVPSSQSLLATAIAAVRTPSTSHQVRLLVDPGSEFSFVADELVSALHLSRQWSPLIVTGIGGTHTTKTKGAVQLSLVSVYSSESVMVRAHVLKKIAAALPSADVIVDAWPHLRNLELADPLYYQSRAVDVLLGADVYGQVIKPEVIRGSRSMPVAQSSIFGWLILGPVSTQGVTAHQNISLVGRIDNDSQALQDLLAKFWEQEEVPADEAAVLSPEEQECENHFRSTHTRDEEGRYVVRIPLKAPISLLGDSYLTAHHRLHRTLQRLARDDVYKELYTQFLEEYEKLGHMARAPVSSQRSEDPVAYYLPHHGVLRPERSTTKLRVVFNGSSSSSSGYSVNDLMHTGANLLLDISDVLIWIRHHRHLFATDVTKMFRQIRVHERDQDLQRILWVDGELNEVPYRLTTVTYGTKSAPFLAVRTMLQLAEDEGHNFPLAVPSLLHGRYVDDIFGGADTEEALLETAQQLQGLCRAGGFPLAKWHATSPSVLAQLGSSGDRQTIQFDDCTTKLLGVQWSPKDDRFTFVSRSSSSTGKISKRLVLSEVAKIFDPLGFISPVTIRAKALIQELWLHKLGWDEPLPTLLAEKWQAVREEFTQLASLSVPRWFNTCQGARVTLHGFSDASQLAMAAVVYLTVDSPSTGKVTSLICSKTKVAPLKRLTIPRLELSGALILAKLVSHIRKKEGLDIDEVFLWTDSKVALTWIKAHPSRWKDYVRNRVTQIQDLTPDCSWMHVPGTCNPADCASRGATTQELAALSLWWQGPSWLTQHPEKWPPQADVSDVASGSEARPGVSLVGALPEPDCQWDLLYRYSSFFKLQRVTALCFRVIDRIRRLPDTPIGRILLPSELHRAQQFWVKASQAASFASELRTLSKGDILLSSHPLSRLTAFIDADGVLRVGGRLDNSALNEESKHPAILSRHSHLSSLIIDEAHRRTLHGGTQLTLSHIRQRFWILGGRNTVRAHVLRCVMCARQRGIRARQLMGQLPLCRVTPSRPFMHTGLDYAGPLTLKTWQGRGAKTHKGWLCVFVCLSTSALHLDVVTDYSTEAFLAAFRRFVSRRGIPTAIYSDCGTNFLGADAALKQMFTASAREHRSMALELSKEGIRWIFNPPAAPHMGGKWEAAVKSVKYHLRRTARDALLTYEQWATLLTQIEALLNSRPLEPLRDDPEDVSALTPGHFLIGSALTTIPEPSVLDLKETRLSHWQLLQQKTQRFWKVWSAHYLHQQQAISKWQHSQDAIQVGALVLISDERAPPGRWPLARVTALHPGRDGLTRVVTLKTATTTLTRPIVKLVLLPTEDTKR